MLTSLPVLIPFATGIALLFLRDRAGIRRTVSVGSLMVQAAVAIALIQAVFTSGILVSHLGEWKAPIGIVLVGDKTAAVLALLAIIVTFASTLAGFAEATRERENPMRLALVQFLLTGLQLSFLTGDLLPALAALED